MRLFELNLPTTITDAMTKLKNAGWYVQGEGGASKVFHKKGYPYVLKLFDNHDKAYIAFIKLVQNNPNIHFPKFFGKLIHVNETYSAIRIERLKKTTSAVNAVDGKFIAFYLSQKYYFDKISSGEISGDMFHAMYQETYDYMKYEPELKQACDLISDHLLDKFELDIFGVSDDSNLMLRGNTVVITDPVSMG